MIIKNISYATVIRISLLAIIVHILLPVQFSAAQTTPCSTLFSTGVQTHGGADSWINFDFNADRIGRPAFSSYLNTPSVIKHSWSPERRCGCYPNGTVLDKVELTDFLLTTSTDQAIVPRKKVATLGENHQTQFSKIQIAEWSKVTFSESSEPYIIDQLYLGYKSSLILPPGQYWIRQLNMEPESRIEVAGEEVVNLFVKEPLTVPFQAKINTGSRDSAKLSIYSNSDITFDVNTETHAFIISDNQTTLAHGARITGGILGQYVQFETESKLTVDPTGSRLIHFGELCTAEHPSDADIDPPTIFTDDFDYTSDTPQMTLTGTVTDDGRNSTGVARVWAVRRDGTVYDGTVDGDRFAIDVELIFGPDSFWVYGADYAGNENYYYISVLFPGRPELTITSPSSGTEFTNPLILIRGELDTPWTEEDFSFVLGGSWLPSPQLFSNFEIYEHLNGVYYFQVNYMLQPGPNRIHIAASIISGEYVAQDIYLYYTPPE